LYETDINNLTGQYVRESYVRFFLTTKLS